MKPSQKQSRLPRSPVFWRSRVAAPRPVASRRARAARRARGAAAIALALAVAIALGACGAKKEDTAPGAARPLRLMLDFFPNADHAALYTALAHGEFRAVGLDVKPLTPADPSEPLKLLAAGRVDAAISYEPELLLARDTGLKLVSIAALIQRPLTSIIALPGHHVTRVSDLAGKRVGTAGIAYQGAELQAALQAAGRPPTAAHEVNVGFNLVPAMLSGQVDATLGGFWNYEGLQLRLAHKHPLVIPIDRAGVPTYDELVLVVREDEARHRGPMLRALVQALSRGENEVRADPAAATQTLLAANPSLPKQLQLESVKQTLPATEPAESGKPYGWQDPSAWAAFGTWMYGKRLLHNDPGAGLPPFSNEFLPGQGI